MVFTLFTFLFVNFEFSFSSIQTGDLNINFDPFCHDYDQGVLLFWLGEIATINSGDHFLFWQVTIRSGGCSNFDCKVSLYVGVAVDSKLSADLMSKKLMDVFILLLKWNMSGWALEVFLPLGRSYRHLMRVETLPSFALILRAQEDCLMGSSKESLHCSFTKSRASSSSIDVLRVTETGL